MKLYLAGPDVFLPDAAEIGARKKARVSAAGAVPLWPLDNAHEVDVETHPKPLVAQAIFEANVAMLDDADGVLLNLTPFRGPSADVGTVWEAGYAFARGKPVFGYSNVAAGFADRARAFLVTRPDGLDVEDFDLAENLMAHCCLKSFDAEDALDPWRDLASFERALARAVASAA